MSVVTHHTVSPAAVVLGLQDDEIPSVVEACPGNGTRYVLVLTPVHNSDADRIIGSAHGSVLVSLWPGDPNSACAVFRRCDVYLAPSYVAEKLRVNVDDADALASILGELLDRPHPGTESQCKRERRHAEIFAAAHPPGGSSRPSPVERLGRREEGLAREVERLRAEVERLRRENGELNRQIGRLGRPAPTLGSLGHPPGCGCDVCEIPYGP